eukprot:s8941_g2.t1
MYFQQYANPDPSARREIHEQLVAEAAQTDMAGVLALYRFLLTGSHLEDFYEEVFRMLVLHVHALPRCVALADFVHHAQEQSDEDVESAAGSAADEECDSTICDSDSAAALADFVHHAQEQSDEDVESAAGSAADEECDSTICDSDSAATVEYAWPEPDE